MADRCPGSIGLGPLGLSPLSVPGCTRRAGFCWPRGFTGAPRWLAAFVAAAGCFVAACDPAPPAPPTPAPSATAAAPPLATVPAPIPAADVLVPSNAAVPSNPLGLPPHPLKLDPGRRVFTFSDRMFAGARLGSTLVLYGATVVGFEGEDFLIEGRGGPSYKVHPGYVIPVPDAPRVRLRDPVLTEWNGVMKHAVVTRFVKDRTEVRYTDMDAQTPLGLLKSVRFVRQVEGLGPGNYAAWKDGDTWRHVLLVSRLGDSPEKSAAAPAGSAKWFALGYGGAALLVEETALRPIPIQPQLKIGASVWAEWVGALRPAVVQSLGDTGLFTVKFERAGRPVTVGWGLVTPPLQ